MRHFSGWMRRPPFATWAAFICVLLATVSARAQGPQAQGPPIIRSIDVQYTGPGTVSKERILAHMRTRVGQPYSDQVVEQDIEALYKTGSILNVRIFAQPEGDGVKVTVAVQTRSIVREIEINGAERIKAKRLRKEIKLKLNQPVNEEQLEEARQKIIEVYQAKGFTDIDVKYRVDAIDEKRGTSRVVYTINEGVKGAVRRIRFEGNDGRKDSSIVENEGGQRLFAESAARRCEGACGCLRQWRLCRSCDFAGRYAGWSCSGRRAL